MSDVEAAAKEELIARLVHKPFEPFAIVMTDGVRFDIVRQLQAAVGEKTGYLVSSDGRQHRRFSMKEVRSIQQAAAV